MMNERIKDLMAQAMESSGVEGLGGSYMELNPEKFAKLIIKECCNIVEGFGDENCAYTADIGIRKHFGVEE